MTGVNALSELRCGANELDTVNHGTAITPGSILQVSAVLAVCKIPVRKSVLMVRVETSLEETGRRR